ncbi:MAG: DUF2877 domain-containing protein, partial [Candidatus Cloacimonetes bacterium]|nr:DUF2877 domain-containing protein [Candidatus Cloacimonadota bacterium]
MEAYFTPEIPLYAEGRVHSVFKRAINIIMKLPSDERMITLTDSRMPGIPDSIQLGRVLCSLNTGVPCILWEDELQVGEKRYPFVRQSAEPFFLRYQGLPTEKERFFNLTEELCTGLDQLPSVRREYAVKALCTEKAVKYIGLGPGLTPSFDDACVGVMAICRAAGILVPFHICDLSVTTDVSARYLKLAQGGYFSATLLRVVDALYGGADLM